jgi:hypothetical protein
MCLAAAAACADVDKVTALVCCDARFSILVGSDAPLSPFNWLRLGLKKKLRFRSSSGRRSARTTTAEETSSSRRQRTRSCLQNCGSGVQRQAERAHDNCRRDVEQQAAANEELSSELQVPSARGCDSVWCGVMRVQQLLQQLRSTESLAETLEHENEQVRAA